MHCLLDLSIAPHVKMKSAEGFLKKFSVHYLTHSRHSIYISTINQSCEAILILDSLYFRIVLFYPQEFQNS